MTRTYVLVACAGLMACTLGAIACSSDPGSLASGDEIARIEVSPAVVDLPVGQTQQLSANAYTSNGTKLSGVSFQWSTTNQSSVTTNANGLVTAVAPGTANITAVAQGKTGQATISVTAAPPAGLVVDVWPSVRYQTMNGWEGVAHIGQDDCPPSSFALYQAPLLDRIVNELGIDRVRLEVNSGFENPVDWATQFWSGQITTTVWKAHQYEIINDNSDPFSINPAGFSFGNMDHTVETVLIPMRQRLSARGEHLYVNLNYVDFGTSSFEHSSDPQEYAEFMLAIFQHMQTKYGFVPDAVEISLEPDNTPNWRGTTIGSAIVATGDRLKAAGFHPDFIAPSNTDASRAVEYFDALIGMPRVREYITDLSYHRYSGVSPAVLTQIGARGATYGIRTGMLEAVGATDANLQDDLKLARVSSWQQYVLAGCITGDAGGKYYVIDLSNPSNPQISLGSRTKLLRQYFYYVRSGAARVGALSGDGRVDPIAFRNPDGRLVVIARTTQGVTFQVRQLPAGTYGITYATATQYNVSLADATVGTSGSLTVAMPAAGVVTVFRR